MNRIQNDVGGDLEFVGLGIGTTLACDGDSTTLVSQVLDLAGIESIKHVVNVQTTLTSDDTMSMQVSYELSTDNSTWGTPVVCAATAVIATGATAALTVYTDVESDLDVMPFNRYIRFTATPSFSATATDSAYMAHGVVYRPKYST